MPDKRPCVVVVLANLMERDGTLNDETAGRVELGCREAERRAAALVLFMGWAYRADGNLPVAEAMRLHADGKALCADIPTETSTLSRDTVGDALFSRLQLSARFPQCDLVVATSDYHVSRTRLIFSRIWGLDRQLDVVGAVTDAPVCKTERETESVAAFLRTFQGIESGDTDAFLDRMLAAHPFYNGQAMPDRPFVLDPEMRRLVDRPGS